MRQRFAQAFLPKRLFPAFSSGLINTAIDLPIELSLAALIFSGPLSLYLSYGIGYALAGVIIFACLVALLSSFPDSIGIPQDTPAALLAIMAAGIAAGVAEGADSQAAFASVVAAITLTTLLTGIVYFALGAFRLGNLVRYIPYPVIGGFLAGTGWLLLRGSLSVMTGMSLAMGELAALFTTQMLVRWLPGFILGITLILVLRRKSHPLILPGFLLGAIAVFYVILAFLDMSVSEASARGLLLGELPEGGLWQPPSMELFSAVDWSLVIAQAGQIAVIVLVCVISLLLNASGVELSSRSSLDINRELRANGTANVVASLVSSPPGFTALSLTVLTTRMSPGNRLNGLFFALIMLLALIFGGPLLALMPIAVLGGVLVYLGGSFLVEWLYDGWSRVSRADYAIVVLMLVAVAGLGPLVGVGLGIVLSAAMFLFEYSRINVVRHAFSASSYHSTVERSLVARHWLAHHSHWLVILELQGFLFFGTANRLFEELSRLVEGDPARRPRLILLDFNHVTGLDASAIISFTRLSQLTQPQGIRLVFTDLKPTIAQKLQRSLRTSADESSWHIFPDLDHGLEWCEDFLLADMLDYLSGDFQDEARHVQSVFDSLTHAALKPFLTRLELQPGMVLIRQGDPPNGIYFLESGQLTVQVDSPAGPIRVRSIGEGTVVGELGLYLNRVTTASVIVTQPGLAYFLPGELLDDVEQNDPQAAIALHRLIVQVVGERLIFNMNTLQALNS